MEEIEEWRDVVGFEGKYKVSNFGRVMSGNRKRWVLMTISTSEYGYNYVRCCGEYRQTMMRIHRIVLSAFVRPPVAGEEACHNDGDRTNNRLSNLRWDDRIGNQADRRRHGTHPSSQFRRDGKFAKAEA